MSRPAYAAGFRRGRVEHPGEDAEARSREYSRWHLRSPDWARLRRLVLERARYTCEACLVEPTSLVHHATYEAGRLPPAYLLLALCRTCHGRVHNPADPWFCATRRPRA